MRQRNLPFRKQPYHGGAVRSFIFQEQRSKIGQALHVIVDGKIPSLVISNAIITVPEMCAIISPCGSGITGSTRCARRDSAVLGAMKK